MSPTLCHSVTVINCTTHSITDSVTNLLWHRLYTKKSVNVRDVNSQISIIYIIVRIDRSNNVMNILNYDAPFTSNIWQYWYRIMMVNNSVFVWLEKKTILDVHNLHTCMWNIYFPLSLIISDSMSHIHDSIDSFCCTNFVRVAQLLIYTHSIRLSVLPTHSVTDSLCEACSVTDSLCHRLTLSQTHSVRLTLSDSLCEACSVTDSVCHRLTLSQTQSVRPALLSTHSVRLTLWGLLCHRLTLSQTHSARPALSPTQSVTNSLCRRLTPWGLLCYWLTLSQTHSVTDSLCHRLTLWGLLSLSQTHSVRPALSPTQSVRLTLSSGSLTILVKKRRRMLLQASRWLSDCSVRKYSNVSLPTLKHHSLCQAAPSLQKHSQDSCDWLQSSKLPKKPKWKSAKSMKLNYTLKIFLKRHNYPIQIISQMLLLLIQKYIKIDKNLFYFSVFLCSL